jgi:hypothetical protein
MNDSIKAAFFKNMANESGVRELAFMNAQAWIGHGNDVGSFDGWIVVVVEAVKHSHGLGTISQEALHSVGTDKSGSAGDENAFHNENEGGGR